MSKTKFYKIKQLLRIMLSIQNYFLLFIANTSNYEFKHFTTEVLKRQKKSVCRKVIRNLQTDKTRYWRSFRCCFGLYFLLLTGLFYNSVKRDINLQILSSEIANTFSPKMIPKFTITTLQNINQCCI